MHLAQSARIFLLTATIFIQCCLFASAQQLAVNNHTHSTFNPKTVEWQIDWPGRVSQYDLAYLPPPIDPMKKSNTTPLEKRTFVSPKCFKSTKTN